MSDYFEKARSVATDAIADNVVGWSAEDISAAADRLMGIGFGTPGLGVTGRWMANLLRKVRPIDSYAEAVAVAGAVNVGTRVLLGSEGFDKEPFLCSHCGQRFIWKLSPKTHDTRHTTVFSPRTF